MNQMNIRHKGILLWVDDNFIEHPFEKDVDTWVKIFGNESDHIYRLMDLQLRIAATYETGKKAIKELVELKKQGVYVFCIIDLKLPINHKSRDFVFSENGMKLAKLAKDNGFNCVFLTTESDRIRGQLVEKGLAAIPYYPKEQKEQVIHGALVQHILSDFRSHISWISLEDIYGELNRESSLFDDSFKENKDNLSIKYFPFFNVFRAFVERWEYLPVPDKRTIVIFRSPKSHCDAFIQQCLLVTLNNLVQDRPGYVSFRYVCTANPQYSDHIQYAPKGLTVNAVRVDTQNTSTAEFFELLNQASKANHITYFILPNDETADEYLEQAARFRRVNYEDLPTIRVGDSFTREAIIRSSLNLVLQHVKISTDDREKKRLGDIYLAYPEILLKPLTWVFLLESHKVAEKLSDPFEIVYEIEKAAKQLQSDQINPNTKLKLINGEPIEISHLLEFGFDALEKDKNKDELKKAIQEEWMPRALKMWLTKSWQFPYGMSKEIVEAQNLKNNGNDGLDTRWEEFSLSILRDLVDNYTLRKGSTELDAVCKFLKHEVINDLLSGEYKKIDDEKWSALLTVKWPHYEYPLPVTLSKKLKKAGRYLWVETDYFNLTQIFPSTRLRYRHLDDVINLIGELLKWVRGQCDNLPEEWAFYIKKFINSIANNQIKSTWENKKEREALYNDLVDFLSNILPLSSITHSILDGALCRKKKSGELFEKFAKVKGFGTHLNIIRKIRKKNLFTYIRPSEHWFFSSRNQTYDFFCHCSQLKDDYCNRIRRDNFIAELKKDRLSLLRRVHDNMPPQEQNQLLEIIGKMSLDADKKARPLDNLDVCTKEKLFNFLKDRRELKEVVTKCGKNDVTDIISGFFKEILEYDGVRLDEKGRYPFSKILDEITVMNANFSAVLSEPEKCQDFFQDNELSTFFSSSFDVFELSLNAYEKISMTLQRLNYVDGYHFLNSITWLRNNFKGVAPTKSGMEIIELIFELFCFGIESLMAQLKFLLKISGENKLSENIKLKFVEEIKLPEGIKKPKKEDLDKFFEVRKQDGIKRYSVFHLGIPGNKAKGKKAIIKDRELIILEERE